MITKTNLKNTEKTELEQSDQEKRATGFVVLNPVAGKGNPDEIREILQATVPAGHYDIYETSGDEALAEVVRTAVHESDYEWVAAVGGDGTVSLVANGLVGSEVPLIIIPAGTGNALAKELGIPQETEAACRQLLTGNPIARSLDALQVGEKYFFLQIGVGLESATMENTTSDQKNQWGLAAYLWTALKEAVGWQPYRFKLTLDDQTHNLKASELVIANAGKIGAFDFEWEETIVPDDGRIDIVVLAARSIGDYLRVIWTLLRGRQRQSNEIQLFEAYDKIEVAAGHALPIHGDGELLEAALPLTAVVVPGALQVMIPQPH